MWCSTVCKRMASLVVVTTSLSNDTWIMPQCTVCVCVCVYSCLCVIYIPTNPWIDIHVCMCVNLAFLPLCVCVVCEGAERNSRERERGSTLAVPEQLRPVQHRSRSVSPHREDSCRARSRPAHVPMQRSVSLPKMTWWSQWSVCC